MASTKSRSSQDSASLKVEFDSLIYDEVFQIFSLLDTQAFAHLSTGLFLYSNARLLLWEMTRRKGFHIPITFADLLEARTLGRPYAADRPLPYYFIILPTKLTSRMRRILSGWKRRAV
jgi:hypothetical protein